MDVLSDVLRVVRLSGAVFFTADFSSPWAIESPMPERLAAAVMPQGESIVLFHILVDGAARSRVHAIRLAMEAGDVVVFPRGDQHVMRSRRSREDAAVVGVLAGQTRRAAAAVVWRRCGRRLVCGYLNCDQRFSPLVEALPTMLLVRSRDDYSAIDGIDAGGSRPTTVPQGSGTWLGTTLKFTVNEARTARPGNAAILGRLTELMFVEILREIRQRLSRSGAAGLPV